MKLYYSPGACSLASHIVLREAGVPFKLERVDLKTHRTEAGKDFYSIAQKGQAFLTRVSQRPAVKEALKVEGLAA